MKKDCYIFYSPDPVNLQEGGGGDMYQLRHSNIRVKGRGLEACVAEHFRVKTKLEDLPLTLPQSTYPQGGYNFPECIVMNVFR